MAATTAWYERMFEGLYARVLPNVFTAEQTRKQVTVVKRLLKLRRGQRVLDVPCGMGRLTIPLARGGVHMTGVDLAGSYIRAARRLARKGHLDIRFVQADMRRIDFDGEFDAAFNWFGSFGYFNDADNLELSRRIRRALRPGGRFLVETMNKTWLLPHFRHEAEQTIADIHILHRARWDPRRSRIYDTWTMTAGRKTERHTISIRCYSGPELVDLLREAGFNDVRLYGYPPPGRLTRHSRRLIAVATRPKE